MLYAQAQEREIDTFVIYTDSETWAGDIHPAQALRDYRRASGIDARLVVVGMVSNGFSIADPNDPGHARRRRLRHGDAAADLRLRPRRRRSAAGAPPSSQGGGTAPCGCGATRQTHRSQKPVDEGSNPSARMTCLRSSAEERRASNPGAEVRSLSEAAAGRSRARSRSSASATAVGVVAPAKEADSSWVQLPPGPSRHRGRAVRHAAATRDTAVRVRPVSLDDNERQWRER